MPDIPHAQFATDVTPEGSAKYRFNLVRFNNVKLAKTLAYLIKDVIPREGLIVVWGPPKCGKTFWVFDAVLHVALGWPYRGRKVQSGAVVYMACEGERGLGARVAAFRQHHGIDDDDPDFHLVTTRLNLVTECDQLIADIQAQIGETELIAIVVDTLNRSIQGSESNDADMTAYIGAADTIRETFRCAVIVIHHCGIENSRPRGHTSLSGAVEAQIAVKQDASGTISTTVEYMKDGEAGDTIDSTLEVVTVGQDVEGDDITSCVVIEADGSADGTRRRPTGQARIALEMLERALIDAGEPAPTGRNIPADTNVVRQSLWEGYCEKGQIAASDKPDSKQKAFKRSAQKLQSSGFIGVWGEWVWLVGQAGQSRTDKI